MTISLRKNSILLIIGLVIGLIVASVSLNFYSRHLVIKHNETIEEIRQVRDGVASTLTWVSFSDVGVRGYILEPKQQFLNPYLLAKAEYQGTLDTLTLYLTKQEYSNMDLFIEARNAVEEYMDLLEQMVELTASERTPEAVGLFKQDAGAEALMPYLTFREDVAVFEKNI
ncbi:MAG: CHASE3 domain-containing protein, partial [Bacteroidota bacterium]